MSKRPLPIIMPIEKPGAKIHRRKDSKKNKKKKKNTQKEKPEFRGRKIYSIWENANNSSWISSKGISSKSIWGWYERGSCAMLHGFNWWQWTRGRWSNFAFRPTLAIPQKEKLSPNAKDDVSKGKEGNSSQPLSPRLCVSCLACIMFSDEDFQLGEKFQN